MSHLLVDRALGLLQGLEGSLPAPLPPHLTLCLGWPYPDSLLSNCHVLPHKRQKAAVSRAHHHQLVALGAWGQVNGRACLASGAPGTCEGDCRLSLDKIGECLVDPSQRGSIVHYQCGHTVKCRQGKRRGA